MMKISNMTENDFRRLLDDYFAPPEKRTNMTEREIKELAVKLNKKINVPFINETEEEKVLIKIVIKLDRFLYNYLPNELYDLIRSTEDGISDKEATRLIRQLTKLANEKVDIPYIPEFQEYIAIKYIIGVIINAARENWNIKEVYNHEDYMIVTGHSKSRRHRI